MTKPILSLTQNARKHLQKLLTKESARYVRLDLRTRGCTGLSYTMRYTNRRDKHEELWEQDGVRILFSPKTLMRVIGTTIDYETNPLRSEFVFHNPNSKATCGCGESFTTENNSQL